jgi:hypothetical protein
MLSMHNRTLIKSKSTIVLGTVMINNEKALS